MEVDELAKRHGKDSSLIIQNLQTSKNHPTVQSGILHAEAVHTAAFLPGANSLGTRKILYSQYRIVAARAYTVATLISGKRYQ